MGPFSSESLIIIDTARVLVGALGFTVGAYQLSLIRHARTQRMRVMCAGAAIAVLALSGGRVENLGQPLTFEFLGAALTVGTFAWASVLLRRDLKDFKGES